MKDLYDPICTGGKVYPSDIWADIINAEYDAAQKENRYVYLSDISGRLVKRGVKSRQDGQNIALIFATRLRKNGRNWLTGGKI